MIREPGLELAFAASVGLLLTDVDIGFEGWDSEKFVRQIDIRRKAFNKQLTITVCGFRISGSRGIAFDIGGRYEDLVLERGTG